MAEEEDNHDAAMLQEDGEMDDAEVEAHISWALGVAASVSSGDVVLAGEPHPSLPPSILSRHLQHREQELQERRCRYEVEAERRGGSHSLQHCRHHDNICRHSGVHGL